MAILKGQKDKIRDENLRAEGFRILRFQNHTALYNPEIILEEIKNLSPLSPWERGRGRGPRMDNDRTVIQKGHDIMKNYPKHSRIKSIVRYISLTVATLGIYETVWL